MYGSKLMSSDEIENILRIQEKFLTSGVPYNEDYYYLVTSHHSKRCPPCMTVANSTQSWAPSPEEHPIFAFGLRTACLIQEVLSIVAVW